MVRIPEDELSIRFTRSSGPGGQNVNKRSTRAQITWDPAASSALTATQKARALPRLRLDARGLVHVSASSARTQGDNRARALARLQAMLDEALLPPPPPRKRTRPSRGATETRISDKKSRGTVKKLRARPSKDED